jgi:peptide/nickel transport system substrate-binding protein
VGTGALLAACGATPTATPVPPTATKAPAPAAPTNTAVPAAPTATKPAAPAATNTPVPPTAVQPTATAAPAAPAAMKYNEAPMLAELVKAGKLPPVDQRLPKKPKVLPVFEKIGKYGGTWRRAYTGVADRFGVHTTIADHLLEMYQPDGGNLTLITNVADSYSVTPDGKQFTWNLREGHKWSDGVEITSDNAVWWYKNILLNEELAPGRLYDNVRQQKDLTAIEAKGKYSFVCTYSKPNGTLPLGVVRGEAWGIIGGLNFLVPSHYLQKYHKAFADPKFLDEEVAKRKLQGWKQLFIGGPIDMFALNPELPMVGPWVTKVPASSAQMVQERNPYYFQVDPSGNQLPYIDKITHEYFENQESFNLMLISGQIDVQYRRVQLKDYTLLKQNEAKGGYKVFVWNTDGNYGYNINPTPRNDDTKVDEEQSKIVSRKEFRQALNLAINRKEVNDLLFNGLAVARQGSPVRGSPVWKKEYDEAFAQYDVAQANKLLDSIGLDKKGADGFRLRPDGKTLTLRLDVDTAPGSIDADMHQLVKGYWEKVGIKVVINAMERSLRETVQFSDRFSVASGSYGNTALPLSYDAWHGTIGGGWGRWIRNKADPLAIEPPAGYAETEAAKKAYAIIEEAYGMSDLDKGHKRLMDALDICYLQQCWSIGIVGETPVPVVVHNRMKNVPKKVFGTNAMMQINMAQPPQFFIDG